MILKKHLLKNIAVLFSAAAIFAVTPPQTFYAVVPEGSNQTINQEDLNKQLFIAIAFKNFAVCHDSIEQGADINATDEYGCTLLHHAAFSLRNKKLMTLLIGAFGADITAKDNMGNTPLHYAAVTGNFAIFDSFSRNSTTWVDCVNTPNNKGQTPLHLAAQCGFDKMCSWLLTHEAKLNVQDELGFTPFDYAFLASNKNLAGQLLYNHFARENCSLAFFFNHKICKECFNKLSKNPSFNLSLNPNPNPNLINTLCPSCQKQFVDAQVKLLERADEINNVAPKLLTELGFPEYSQEELDSFIFFLEHSLCQSCCFKVLNHSNEYELLHPCKSCKEKLNKYIQEQLKLKNKQN